MMYIIHCSVYSVVDIVVYMIVCMFMHVPVCMSMYTYIHSNVHECVCVCRCVQWHECILSEHTNCQYCSVLYPRVDQTVEVNTKQRFINCD